MSGDATKARVLQTVAGSGPYTNQGHAHYRIGRTTVHVRYKSKASHGAAYPYNINPNTLRADYELWICGDSDGWHLIPMELIRKIYQNPHAYVDTRHPEIRVVTVNVSSDEAAYGTGGRTMSMGPYRNVRLPE